MRWLPSEELVKMFTPATYPSSEFHIHHLHPPPIIRIGPRKFYTPVCGICSRPRVSRPSVRTADDEMRRSPPTRALSTYAPLDIRQLASTSLLVSNVLPTKRNNSKRSFRWSVSSCETLARPMVYFLHEEHLIEHHTALFRDGEGLPSVRRGCGLIRFFEQSAHTTKNAPTSRRSLPSCSCQMWRGLSIAPAQATPARVETLRLLALLRGKRP